MKDQDIQKMYSYMQPEAIAEVHASVEKSKQERTAQRIAETLKQSKRLEKAADAVDSYTAGMALHYLRGCMESKSHHGEVFSPAEVLEVLANWLEREAARRTIRNPMRLGNVEDHFAPCIAANHGMHHGNHGT